MTSVTTNGIGCYGENATVPAESGQYVPPASSGYTKFLPLTGTGSSIHPDWRKTPYVTVIPPQEERYVILGHSMSRKEAQELLRELEDLV